MPIAEISGARRNEPRSGLYATRSMAQFSSPVRNMAMSMTRISATMTEEMPSTVVKRRKKIIAMKADTMKTSPCAKLTMPMMPNTIV